MGTDTATGSALGT